MAELSNEEIITIRNNNHVGTWHRDIQNLCDTVEARDETIAELKRELRLHERIFDTMDVNENAYAQRNGLL